MRHIILMAVRTRGLPNACRREHHMARARRVARERHETRLCLLANARPLEGRGADVSSVELVRCSPRLVDSDAAVHALKAVRDEVAAFLGVDDGPQGPITWTYDQDRAEGHGVIACIEVSDG